MYSPHCIVVGKLHDYDNYRCDTGITVLNGIIALNFVASTYGIVNSLCKRAFCTYFATCNSSFTYSWDNIVFSVSS